MEQTTTTTTPQLIDRKDFYLYKCTPEKYEETKNRLQKMQDAGMSEVGNASFGIKGVTSGYYIERVWSDSDATFNDYLQWIALFKKL